MEAGAKAQEDNYCGGGICDHGMDGIFNYRHSQISTSNMGSLQYPGYFKGEQQSIVRNHHVNDRVVFQ